MLACIPILKLEQHLLCFHWFMWHACIGGEANKIKQRQRQCLPYLMLDHTAWRYKCNRYDHMDVQNNMCSRCSATHLVQSLCRLVQTGAHVIKGQLGLLISSLHTWPGAYTFRRHSERADASRRATMRQPQAYMKQQTKAAAAAAA
jgi:hypothetical protein